MRPKRTTVATLLATIVLSLLVLSTLTHSLSTGIDRGTTSQKLPPEGCVCHGPSGANGVPNANVTVLFEIEGNPFVYKPATTYNLTVGANQTDVPAKDGSNQGGFNLKVSVGQLAPAPGFENFIQVTGSAKQEATHTVDGDKNGRIFNLTWKSPSAAEEPAVFTLFVNTVNGDLSPSELDHWAGTTKALLHKADALLAGAEAQNPEDFGVKWLAHWVGIVSFLAVIGTLLIYYFVLKYGESVHTTDHRDRKEK